MFGDAESGKSAMLRAIASEIQRLYTPDKTKIFAVALRRSLLAEFPAEYLAGYLTTQDLARDQIAALPTSLRSRLPGPDVTAEQLRSRSWWPGAEAFVLVDDDDLVATSSGNPLSPLVPLLAQAGDLGLLLVLTRRSGGAGRALHEPLLQTLSDLAAPGIMLSGNPAEGALVGAAKPFPGVPGRGQIVTRDHGRQVIQLAFEPPAN